jgi:hypothetical protein
MGAFVDGLEKQFEAEFKIKVPTDILHLKWMGVVPEDYVRQYNIAVGLEKAPDATAPTSPGHTTTGGVAIVTGADMMAFRGSAVHLWWPPVPEAVTFQEMKEQREVLKAVAGMVISLLRYQSS